VYWLRLQRGKDGSVDFVPQLVDGDCGVGRHIRVGDINGDKIPDIVVGGMKGGAVLTHRVKQVDEATWRAAQPKARYPAWPLLRRGPGSPIDPKSGGVEGAQEGEALKVLGVSAGSTSVQDMTPFHPDHWSGGKQLFWTGAQPGDKLNVEIAAPADGEYDVRAVFTMARDYGAIQCALDDQALGGELDLYNFPDVITTGVLTLGRRKLTAGAHKLTLELKGSNPSAMPANMVGVDYVQLGSPTR
jgi:hypothetical protein